MNKHTYSKQQLNFLEENFKQLDINELTTAFNNHFGLNLSTSQLRSTVKRHKFKSGRTGHFVSGATPWNTGTKGRIPGSATCFKKGNRPKNWCPVGTERYTSVDKFIKVKIAEPNVWVFKHRKIWEEENGPVPAGMVIVFKDGDRENCILDNLQLISRGVLAQYNKNKASELPPELRTPMRALVAIKISQRKAERRLENAT